VKNLLGKKTYPILMINITNKSNTLRTAIATAIVKVSLPETIKAIIDRQVPKGDVFEMSKAAGLLAVKKTSNMIPDCHPIPIEYASITFNISELEIHINVEVHTIYKTGVEVEAIHAATVVAVTIYDMLKPIDKNITIEKVKLLEKTGGMSQFRKKEPKGITAAVIVCSDSVSVGNKEDKAGKQIIERLKTHGVNIKSYEIIPDDKNIITDKVNYYSSESIQLLIFTGGTGLSPRDVTPEVLEPLLDFRIPGIEEAMRSYGQQRTPYAMLSRSLAGIVGKTLVLALPGSTRGASESVDAIFPSVLHIYRVMKGVRHD
jgi:molybdenum cofactor biosynthesis protein MoaC